MQVERYPAEMSEEVRKNLGIGSVESYFDDAEEFSQGKLESLVEDETVKEVHIFKASPVNLHFAGLRKQFPGKTRKQLRKMMKG